MIVVPSVAAIAQLDLLTDSWETWYHLYTNDPTLDENTAKDAFLEAAWSGYLPRKMSAWTPALWSKGRAVAWGEQLQWISPGTIPVVQVYGYFVTNGQDGALLFAERNPTGPIDAGSPGEPINVYPEFSLQQCSNP